MSRYHNSMEHTTSQADEIQVVDYLAFKDIRNRMSSRERFACTMFFVTRGLTDAFHIVGKEIHFPERKPLSPFFGTSEFTLAPVRQHNQPEKRQAERQDTQPPTDTLPKEAQRLDQYIAMHEHHIYFWTGKEWRQENVGFQLVKIIKHLLQRATDHHDCAVRVTDLGGHFAKECSSAKTKCSSISTRLGTLKKLCVKHGCKQVLIKSGRLWQINPDIDCCAKLRRSG